MTALTMLCATTALGGCSREEASNDPCSLLSADEAVPFVGVLASPPYRASDGAADVRGDECMYRGSDGRQIAVRPTWSGGGLASGVLRGVPGVLGSVMRQGGVQGADSLINRVMQQAPAGPWDHATWMPGGSLFATKGDAEVSIDVTGASGEEKDGLELARMIVPRFGHPLHYDGAKAVVLAPKPPAHPAKACDLVPRSEVEAAIGPLAGSPSSDTPESSCTYRVSTPDGGRSYPVEFAWQGGQKNFSMLKHGMAMVGGLIGAPSSSPLDTMTPPPQMQAAIGGLMKMIGAASGQGGATAAPGAAATIGFRTDTTLKGPWDSAALLHGTQLIAVRHDVSIGIGLMSADYEKAKALLAAICGRL